VTEVRRQTAFIRRGAILASCLLGTSCASLLHGTKQRIQVFSEPPGATASAGDQHITTPGELVLPRKSISIEVRVAKQGYVPKTVRLIRRVSGAVWWNAGWVVAGAALGLAVTQADALSGSSGSGDAILLGGVGLGGLGFFVDFQSGAAYRLEPAILTVKLEPEGQGPPGDQ